MRYGETLTPEEIRLIENLKGKNRMEQDQIIAEYENNDGGAARIMGFIKLYRSSLENPIFDKE